MDFTYTATGTTQDILLTLMDSGQGPHMAGFTNQLISAVPEPSAYALLLSAFITGWIIIRRRFF